LLDELEFAGGHPGLDLVNTVDPRGGTDPPVDHLPDFDALCRWAVPASLLTDERADALARAGERDPGRAAATWRRAIELREALHGVLVAMVEGRGVSPSDIATVAEEGRQALAQLGLERRAGAGEPGSAAFWLVLEEPSAPEGVLLPVARAAIELLTDVDASRLRICPVHEGGCGWVVLDTTRNRSRRWCDMAACGTEAKSRRLTERRRAARETGG